MGQALSRAPFRPKTSRVYAAPDTPKFSKTKRAAYEPSGPNGGGQLQDENDTLLLENKIFSKCGPASRGPARC